VDPYGERRAERSKERRQYELRARALLYAKVEDNAGGAQNELKQQQLAVLRACVRDVARDDVADAQDHVIQTQVVCKQARLRCMKLVQSSHVQSSHVQCANKRARHMHTMV
jgi:hypothetical protein